MKKLLTGPFMFNNLAVCGESTNGESDRVCLPDRVCETCGEVSEHSLAIPSAKYPRQFPLAKLARRSLSRTRNRNIEMPRIEFEHIAEAFGKVNPKIPQTQFLPGAWVGPITLRITGKLRDVIWSGIIPFFSGRLVKAIQASGVHLRPNSVAVTRQRKREEDYYYCLPAVTELWSPKALSRFYDRCSVCGEIQKKRGISLVGANHRREYVKAAWPNKEGIVYSSEHQDLLFSDAFVEVARRPEFDGLAFEHLGRWA